MDPSSSTILLKSTNNASISVSYTHLASCINIFSVTKSIISILIGIAADRGEIQSVNQKVLDFFPDFPVENYNEGETTIRDITLRDLMTMTAPYKHQEEPYLEYFTRDDWVSTALELLGGPEKAGKFRYTPFIGPDILSGILVKATGQSVLDFAEMCIRDRNIAFRALGRNLIGTVQNRNIFQSLQIPVKRFTGFLRPSF